jgi:hypothetical protein
VTESPYSESPKPASLVSFYREGTTDDEGRTLAEILSWDDEHLEAVHDFIQWLFPLPEPSGANPNAPILHPLTIRIFQGSISMQQRLRQSLERMLRFYGLHLVSGPAGIAVERAPNFDERAQIWLWPMNHNHLRLTRILRSTLLLGLEAESKALFQSLNTLYREFPDRIPARTHAFWSSAASS